MTEHDNLQEKARTFAEERNHKLLPGCLQLELDQIANANRIFFKGRERQRGAKERYEERKIRIVEIRTELASLMNAKKCA
jgi:hypothetical protein